FDPTCPSFPTDELSGHAGVDQDRGDGLAGVAYWMLPAARGRGLCTTAVKVVCRWAFEEAGFHRIEVDHSTRNEASCRVAMKSGFREEGIRRSAALHVDGWHDMHVHALLATDERP
ncbi:GNAT family protein, partial [Mycolicibacterium llatzerense]